MTVFYTAAVYHRKAVAERNIVLVDTTVKSGNKAFAPSWDIVQAHKQSDHSIEADTAYLDVYVPMMRFSYRENLSQWLALFEPPEVALGCYCKPGAFCHRHVLVDMLEAVAKKHNLPFSRGGEIVI